MTRQDQTNHVRIFDTTLRDGEQAPGFSMSTDAKLIVARALQALNVDIMEAGFAAASPGDAAAVRTIADEIEGPTICSLARANKGDIEAAARRSSRRENSAFTPLSRNEPAASRRQAENVEDRNHRPHRRRCILRQEFRRRHRILA
ncbi:MAG: hypothetical protein R3C42_06875 [Parvularculaceae bacterium]